MTNGPQDTLMQHAQQDQVLSALVSSTRILTALQSTIQGMQTDFGESRKVSRELANSMLAKMDNIDRSMGEVRLLIERSETQRAAEIQRIYDLLEEERKDRRKAVQDGKEGERSAVSSEREMLRELIREEIEARKDAKNLLISVGKAVWDAGGRWIVAAVAVLVTALITKATGMSLADILGIAGK